MLNKRFKGFMISMAAVAMAMNPIGMGNAGVNTVITAEAASSFTISDTSSKILKGDSVKLTTNWSGSGDVTWTTSNKKVATVTGKGTKDKNCTVKAVGVGTATITGKTKNDKKVTCKVTVYEGKLSKTKIEIELGRETATLKFTGGSGKETWKLGNKTVATLTKKSAHAYKIAGLKPGKVNAVVTDGNNTYKCLVTVVKPSTLKTVKAKMVRSLNFDDTTSFKLTNDANLKVTWKVNNGNSVKITSSSNTNCSVKGIALGKSTIEAFCDSMNKKWVWDVNVKAVSTPYFTQNPLVLTVGDSTQVPLMGTVTSVRPSYKMNSSDAILLASDGAISARKVGTAKIYVVADGVSLELDVVVKAKEETKPAETGAPETEKQPVETEAPETEKNPVETEKQPETEKPKETESEKQTESETKPVEPEEPKEPETDSSAEVTPSEPESKLKYTYDLGWWDEINGVQVESIELAGGEDYDITVKTDASINDLMFVGTTGAVEVDTPKIITTPAGTTRVSCYVYGRNKGVDKVKIYAEGRNLIGELTVTVTSDDEHSRQYAAWFENVIKANKGFYDDSISEIEKLINCMNYIRDNYSYPSASADGFTIDKNGFMLYGQGNCLEASATMIYYAKELMKNSGSQITQAVPCRVNRSGVLPTHIVAGIRINGVLYGFDASPIPNTVPGSQPHLGIESAYPEACLEIL